MAWRGACCHPNKLQSIFLFVNAFFTIQNDAMVFKPNMYDFGLQASQGFIEGVQTLLRTGFNPDIDTATTPEDIWTGGGIWVPPTASRVHDIVSTDATDTAAGAGARTISIVGLREWDQKETSEIVTLNGLTPVQTVNSYVMINRLRAETSGATLTNAGDITATAQVDATVTAVISANNGESSMAIYGISALQAMHFRSFSSWLVDTGGVANEIRLQAAFQLNSDQPDSPFIDAVELGIFAQGTSYMPFILDPPAILEGPAIVKVRCVAVTANNAAIGAGFNGYLIDKRNI